MPQQQTPYCHRVVSYLKKGATGPQGPVGRLPVPYGTYGEQTSYTCTDQVAPVVMYNNLYYVMNKNVTWVVSSNPNPAQDYATYGSNATWIYMTNFKAIFAELFMANYGKIASAVFYGNLMFSQQGIKNGTASSDYSSLHVDSNGDVDESSAAYFKPNVWINFLNGKLKARNADIQGKITCTEGKIGGFDIGASSIGTDGATSIHDEASFLESARLKLDSIDLTYGARTAELDARKRGNNLLRLECLNYTSMGPLAYLKTSGAEAIRVVSGMFAGLRPHISSQASGTLTYEQNIVIANNGSQSTLYLPSSPEKGQMFFIYHLTSNNLTINGNGKSIKRLTASGLTTVTDTYSGSIEVIMCNWDGSYWYLTYIKVS